MTIVGRAAIGAVTLCIVACASSPPPRRTDNVASRPSTETKPATPPPSNRGSGGYYLDDGPGANPPADIDLLPDAVPRVEKYASGANRPYNVFGVDYVPDLSGTPYKQRGVGSWYGRKFHGQRTSSGEIYDMYAMTAAHPTLPIPCYALVTNLANGRSVIVRVNDRGPFLHNRIMDLSYTAAHKLGYLSSGSGMIEVEMLRPADIAAGRIPVTSNSLLVASAPRSAMPASSSPPTSIAPANTASAGLPPAPIVKDPVVAASGAPIAEASTALPDSLIERGVPADLIAMPDREPAPSLPQTATGAGFYLQLGAFKGRIGADSFAAHVGSLIDPALASRLQVSEASGLYRVRVGPYPNRIDADRAAASLRLAIAKPVLVLPDPVTR